MFVDRGVGTIHRPSGGPCLNFGFTKLYVSQTKMNMELLTELEPLSIAYYKHGNPLRSFDQHVQTV